MGTMAILVVGLVIYFVVFRAAVTMLQKSMV